MKPQNNPPRIVVLGGINTDYVVQVKNLPEAGQTVQGRDLFIGPGGKGANQAASSALNPIAPAAPRSSPWTKMERSKYPRHSGQT
jgi:hypothetical protein